jgi:hypothetical protein
LVVCMFGIDPLFADAAKRLCNPMTICRINQNVHLDGSNGSGSVSS